MQKYNFFQIHKKKPKKNLLYFCNMEKKIGFQFKLYVVILGVIWLLLLIVQIRLARKAYSHQKDLFAVELNSVFEEAFATIDTLNYDDIDSLVSLSLQAHSISYPHDLGVYSEDDMAFLFLTENADTDALLESGFRYKLVRVNEEQLHLDTIIIHFPSLVKRFHRDTITIYLIIFVLLLLLLCCFINFFYVMLKQRKINTFREKMAHFITHELRTPLTTINLSTQLLKDNSVVTDEETKNSYLDMIAEETKILESLVDEVLTVFRLESVPIAEKKEVSIHELLKEVCKVHIPQLTDCAAQVNYAFKAEHDVVIGNYTHLFNAISNLVDNAIKYRKDKLQLDIGTRNVDNGIEISVSDNGIGISKENMSLIFEPFTRFNTDNSHYVKGFGLGLDYVKHIVEYHKGMINVESELDQGTTFIIFLPLKKE